MCVQAWRLIAGPGALDPTFGSKGQLKFGFGGGFAAPFAAIVQGDGKLLLAGYANGLGSAGPNNPGGDFLLARFTTNNVLDTSFGDGGKVVTRVTPIYPGYPNATSESSCIQALAVQPGGNIVAAGFAYAKTNYSDLTLARYHPDGTLDTSFGTNGNGIVYTDLGRSSQIQSMGLQADGKIVVGGLIATNYPFVGYPLGLVLARYDTNGVLDPSFGAGGASITPGQFSATAILIQGDGKILAGGNYALFRFTTNGVLDSSFGGAGQVNTPVQTISGLGYQLGNFTVQVPDKIIVAGTIGNNQFAVSRYSLGGTLDTSFGNSGLASNTFIPGSSFGQCIGVNVQGFSIHPRLITVGGYASDGANYYFGLARYNAAGVLDTTFGTGSSGIVTLSLGPSPSISGAAYAMTLDSGEFVVAGNRVLNGGESDFAAARFTGTGAVDTTFGNNGLLVAPLSDAPALASALAIQPDTRMVAVGTAQSAVGSGFALARLNADGSFDSSFGNNGKETTLITSNDQATAVALQPDSKIVVGGNMGGSFGVARYNPDGTLDTAFGNNGTASIHIAVDDNQLNALVLQPDGKIVAAGAARDASTYQHFALARFDTNGILDTSFGSAGTVITSFSAPPSIDQAWGAAIQHDGKLIAAGETVFVNGGSLAANFAVARYNPNGSLDLSFGSFGRTTENVGGGTLDLAYALATQPDGKIIVAGAAGVNTLPGPGNGNQSANSFLALARFNTNGTLDASFGSSGSVVTEVSAFSDYALAVALQPDGKIVVSGATQTDGLYKFLAVRYLPNGTLDTAFGNNGATGLDFASGNNEFAYALALDSLGRPVLAGDAGGLFGLARLQGDIPTGPALKISLTASNTIAVSWPYPSTGWNLLQNSGLNPTNWVPSTAPVSNDGTNNFILLTPAPGSLFFRLVYP